MRLVNEAARTKLAHPVDVTLQVVDVEHVARLNTKTPQLNTKTPHAID